jgi:hypothetical protein
MKSCVGKNVGISGYVGKTQDRLRFSYVTYIFPYVTFHRATCTPQRSKPGSRIVSTSDARLLLENILHSQDVALFHNRQMSWRCLGKKLAYCYVLRRYACTD